MAREGATDGTYSPGAIETGETTVRRHAASERLREGRFLSSAGFGVVFSEKKVQ